MAKKGTFPANAMRRGEIYWVDIPNAIGHELMKDRPAIIVSCDALNDNSPVVQVVYCSASPKKELPEHITIRSTEQIKADNPDVKAVESYAELMAEIKKVMGIK